MKKNIDDIAIFGAGIGGLMTNIALHKHGFNSQVYERNCAIRPEGMGFILLADGLADMYRLGILSEDHWLGVPLHEYCQHHPQGQSIKTELMPRGAMGVSRKNLLTAYAAEFVKQKFNLSVGYKRLLWMLKGKLIGLC